jgi:hypothetical protein
MIEKLMTNSRATEVHDVATRLMMAFDASGVTDPNLARCFTSLGEKIPELTKAINRPKTISLLKEKDAVRDLKIRAFHQLLSGYSCHPSEFINAAAQKLLKVFDNYGTAVTRDSYTAESSLLGSLLLNLANPELQGEIAKLSGIAELIAAIQAAQDDFEQVRVAYAVAKAKEGIRARTTKIKMEVVEIINSKLVIYLRAMQQLNPETYGIFAATCSQIIGGNNEQLKKRQQKPVARIK